jgi:hypothetical protein
MQAHHKLRLRSLRAKLPTGIRKLANSLDHVFASRVRVFHDPSVHPPDRLERGAVTFSLDFELAWAWHRTPVPGYDALSIGMRERTQVPRIVKAFDDHMIPSTWATVGHVFLGSCRRGPSGLAHPELPRIPHVTNAILAYPSGDWYDVDPCTDVHRDPAWYGPDLVELIQKAKAGHEIACHSFSHQPFGSYCPPEVVAAEIDACAEAMAPFGLRPTTFVFPRNDSGNFDALAGSGVKIVRAFHRKDADISLPVRREDGMWAVPVSSALGRGQGWTAAQRLQRLQRLVDSAMEQRLSAHFWLHPSLKPTEMEEVLFPLLRYCAELRDRGHLDVLTMERLVEQTARRAQEPPVGARRP